MKKILALVLSLAMCFALLTACGSNGGSTAGSDASTSAPASDASASGDSSDGGTSSGSGGLTGTLKLGAIGPLTGANALYGNAAANGDSIAVEEINALGSGFQIELNSQDDEGDAEKSVNA